MRVRSQDWWERVVLQEFSDQESSKVHLRTTAAAISKVFNVFKVFYRSACKSTSSSLLIYSYFGRARTRH